VLLVAGVAIYNVVVERSARKRAEAAFGERPPDALFTPPADRREPAERREPTLGSMPPPSDVVEAAEAVAPMARTGDAPLPPAEASGEEAQISSRIDTVAVILADESVKLEQLEALRDALGAFGDRVRCEGIVDEQWFPVDTAPLPAWRELRVGLQIANRKGPLTEEDIERFNSSVADFAASVGAVSQREAPSAAAARARELDAFCADADIEVAVNVIGQFGGTFSLAKVKALALEQGLAETSVGEMVRFAADGTPAFVVRRFEDPKSKPAATYTPGVTFALDLPHVHDAPAVLTEMVAMAQRFAASLGGQLVDDARRPLSDAGLSSIRRTLEGIHRQMESHGIPAGGPLARRLFS
jgi:hypothetical protein